MRELALRQHLVDEYDARAALAVPIGKARPRVIAMLIVLK